MCGIAGFIGQGDKKILSQMTDSIRHRGPDDEGFFVLGETHLGMRRLSIIDLAGGKQPIFNEDGQIAVIFNGEIYNFLELKDKLVKNGHQFKTKSDTEVIAHLYEEEGEKLFEKLNGMFAIALWDDRKKKLVLARDRFGKKPLYYCVFDQTFVFGSELKAILKHPSVKKELDMEALNYYLTYEYVPTPKTIFKNIFKLEPASYLIFQNGKIRKEKFYDIKFGVYPEKLSEKEYMSELDKQLERAVSSRLISDVPLGIFLSGGLDSGTIAYYAQKASSQKIKTFSIGFSDPSFDESVYARKVSHHLDTEHHEHILEAEELFNLVPKITDLLDEPLADASIVPTYLLSKFTKEKVTVALSGDGGDELLMGYPTFQAHQLAHYYLKIPRGIREKFIKQIIGRLPVSFGNISLDYRLKRFILGLEYKPEYHDLIWIGSFTDKEKKKLFRPEILQSLSNVNEFDILDRYEQEVKGRPFLEKAVYLYLKTYLLDDILVKTDRASMFASLEVRAPFLDYQLVDFINSIPIDLKLKGFTTKYILKKLMADKLPLDIVNRKKKGFGVPVARWLRGELRPLLLEVLSRENIEKYGIFNYAYVKQLIDEHLSGRRDNRKLLWTVMIFQMWQQKWGV
ncbi:TPA: asparagine synthase (glutamine-hydrolyzing) [Candidatus Azambacteria bacterium]|nr:asparagine synthase (glutamine-hydrolyzing) [Candidatus Azambacteria bacterium]